MAFICLLSVTLILYLRECDLKPVNQRPELFLTSFENATVHISLNHTLTLGTVGTAEFQYQTGKTFINFIHDDIANRETVFSQDGHENKLSENDIQKFRLFKGTASGSLMGTAVLKLSQLGVDICIMSGKEVYIVEPAARYVDTQKVVDTLGNKTANFETPVIIFRNQDVIFPYQRAAKMFSGHFFHGNDSLHDRNASEPLHRRKRSAHKTECTLHLVADHVFYEHTGGRSQTITMAEMAYMTQQANLVFRSTDFNGDGTGDNIGFYIKKFTIYTQPSHKMAYTYDVADYLESFAEYDFEDFCLASVFTSRDFEGGVVGLAWLGSSSMFGSPGGICQKRITYQGKAVSLNTNLVTNVNADRTFSSYLTALTLAHEFGHNFGSPHDEVGDTRCVPDNSYGNYLMYPYTSAADKPNNVLFSPCSINYIFPVIIFKATCFVETIGAVCGNAVVEEGEECDCGTRDTCAHIDTCCTPGDVLDADLPCTFRRSHGSQCSPRTSRCCSNDCQVMSATSGVVCKLASECTAASHCDGLSNVCPKATDLDNGATCANDRKSCFDGKCIGSVCAAVNMTECSSQGPYSCYVCCLQNNSQCLPAHSGYGAFIPRFIGESCNNMNGYCDGHGECVALDPEGTYKRLNEFFDKEDAEIIKEWLCSNWYYVVLGVAVSAGLVTLFVTTCRGDGSLQTNAYMYGKFSRIQREAEMQKAYLERRRAEVKMRYERRMETTKSVTPRTGMPRAVARLIVFFPTVETEVLLHTLRISGSEAVAVKTLLMKNHPFRRVYEPVYDSVAKTLDCVNDCSL